MPATASVDLPPQQAGEGGAGGGGDASGGAMGGADPSGSGGGVVEVGGGAVDPCPPDLTQCGSVCVDLQSNPYHCGGCFEYCPTESCVAGICDGSTLGHVAVLGMSFHEDHAPSRHLLGNAVFLPSSLDVALLTYAKHAHPVAVKNVTSILATEASKRGRIFSETFTNDADDLAAQLDTASFDVVLIHDLALAPPGHGLAFATTTQQALEDFGQQGGIIVALATSNDEMPTLLSETGLLATAGLIPIEGALLSKTAPTDALALGVPAPFSAKFKTSAIVATEPSSPLLSFVFSDDSAAANPVVIHKVLPASP
ncbi:MAG TPA: hypothetical protein ENK57_03055 [Polyangiaceae bacterium]|nr:hypothetical protein [Polyangiaceae bacterium]